MPTLKLWIGRPKEVRASIRDDPVGHGRLAAIVDFGQPDNILRKALYVVIFKAAIPVLDTWESMTYGSSKFEKRG